MLFGDSNDKFDHVTVIPAYDEKLDFIERLQCFNSINNLLLILVVNQPIDALNQNGNRLLFETLVSADKQCLKHQNVYRLTYKHLQILMVDRFSDELRIPSHQGVGLARKIGADLATACIAKGIALTPWIYSTDADAHLPNNYFSNAAAKNISARVFAFKHTRSDNTVAIATTKYEQALRYYVDGLTYAKSPYAFYTLGSILAINITAYCQVRGFPKRAGGEDFYLLNKLAKVGGIVTDPDIVVLLESRLSTRVPFGTGPAVARIIETEAASKDYCYYNPAIFAQLKTLLSWIQDDCYTQVQRRESEAQPVWALPEMIIDVMNTLGFEKFLVHARDQCKTKKIFIDHFHHWFDAFQTLKFIHGLQKSHFPPTPLKDCLEQAKHWNNK